MPEGTATDITEGQGGVAETASSTSPSPSVSVQAPTTPAANPPRSDPEVRLRTMQSEMEKWKAQANALTLEKASWMHERGSISEERDNLVTAARIEKESAIATAAEATRQAIAKAEAADAEVARLRAEAARLKFVIDHPDLMPYASLVPATTDEAQLSAVATQIAEARKRDFESINSQIAKGAAVVPPASPSRPSGKLSSEELDAKLKEARRSGNSLEFERLLAELAKSVGTVS